jgi:hypothetical protein
MTEGQARSLEKGQKLKKTRKAIQARMRQRARRDRIREASPEAAMARADAQLQEEFVRRGPPTHQATPARLAAWSKLVSMGPSARREYEKLHRDRLAQTLPPGTAFSLDLMPPEGGEPTVEWIYPWASTPEAAHQLRKGMDPFDRGCAESGRRSGQKGDDEE